MILEDFGNCSKETYTKEDDRKTQVDYLYKKNTKHIFGAVFIQIRFRSIFKLLVK